MQHPFRDPAVSRAPPPTTDDVERVFQAQLARRRRLMIGLAVAGVLVVLSPFLVIAWRLGREVLAERAAKRALELDAGEKKELDSLLASAERTLDARDAGFRAATTPAALAALEPSYAACPYAPRAPNAYAAASYVTHGSIDVYYFGDASYVIAGPDGRPATSPNDGDRAAVTSIREAVAQGRATKRDLARARGLAEGASRSFTFVVVEEETPPVVTGGLGLAAPISYVGGTLRGRAYLYRTDAGRVACVGDIEVENSEAVDVRSTVTTYNGTPLLGSSDRVEATRAALRRDLEVAVRRALATDLRDVD